MQKIRKLFFPCFIPLSAVTGAFFTVRYLGRILGTVLGPIADEETRLLFAEIFGQLETASVLPHLLFPLLLGLCFYLLLLLTRPSGVRSFLLACAAVVFLLLAYTAALLFAEVNGIRLYDVLASLIQYIRNGLLESL